MLLLLIILLIIPNYILCGNVYTTYHWHMQQPIYWPAKSFINNYTYQKAYESENVKNKQGGHPYSNINSIFSKPDRINDYIGNYPVNTIKQCSSIVNTMGAQISYSGCLIENINSLAQYNTNGYSNGWNKTYSNALNTLKSPSNERLLDLTSFTYHHALGPLIDSKSLDMEINIHKVIYFKTWNTNQYSKGFFPAEMSFSERMIPTLVKNGIEWVIVANNHLSRACTNYQFSTSGDNNDPPNRADQNNPPQTNWFKQSVSRGCTPNNAYPFSFQPHRAQYIDPETGEEYSIIVVPAAMAMSWQDSCQCYGLDDIEKIAANTSENMLILLAHDGDNFFAGGNSYYTQCVPNFVQSAKQKNYKPTTIQQFLIENPPDKDDIVSVEDGSWINADGDFGAPQCLNWNWPLVANNSKEFDIPNGWALKERNWAIITAGQNWVETAENQTTTKIHYSKVQQPDATSTNAELAWHFFLPSLTSGYMYYGSGGDMPVKQTIAVNNAVEYAKKVVNEKNNKDLTPPSIWTLQRLPWNPGAFGAGSLYNYKLTNMTENFYIWTFIYDISKLKSVNLYFRTDKDGIKSIENNVYNPKKLLGIKSNQLSEWNSLKMNQRKFPTGNVYNENIDLTCDNSGKPCLPNVIADEYYIEIPKGGYSNQLMDYYVEAIDTYGNSKKTDIYHVYIA